MKNPAPTREPRTGPERRSAGARAGGRPAAAAILDDVLGGRSLSAAVPERLGEVRDPRERALARELATGVVRHLPSLRHLLGGLLDSPLRSSEGRLEGVLLLGLYQILHTRVPPHAAVHETVRLAGSRPWRRGLANAVLRRAAAERDALLAGLAHTPDLEARYDHPRWMLDRLRADWPGEWEAIVSANRTRAPMTLRAARRAGGRTACLQALREADLGACAHPVAPDAVVLDEPVAVDALPGFEDGAVSVQDAAAQLAVPLLDLGPGMRVLDACAAPGGKTAQIVDVEPCLREVVAVDVDPDRLARAARNLARTGGGARLVAADASDPGGWWDGAAFDRVLVDAPCSGSGVIRRHPDIKLHRRAADLDELAARQAALLDAAWSMLAPSGRLVYATCSVLSREGSRQMARFLERHRDAEPIEFDGGRACGPGRQVLPGENDMDGFFHACVSKKGP
ncbi:MAG: 16S rRNA (cytosine(967)-C(5))-methyltransferase RsmB [Immundisolibacterales bacterium]|nr:16S rRNA (cytosine(967)-C(5))-methyltransferase RsmB [Immundisolibacterales bacterium]